MCWWIQAKEVSQQAERTPTSAAAEQDAKQCLYETDWQVTEPCAPSISTPSEDKRGNMLLWTSRHSNGQLAASLHPGSGVRNAAAVTLATLRHAQALQQILSAPSGSTLLRNTFPGRTSKAMLTVPIRIFLCLHIKIQALKLGATTSPEGHTK